MLDKIKQFRKENEEKIERVSEILFFCGYLLWLIWKFWCITVLSLPKESSIHDIVHCSSLVLLIIPFLYALTNRKNLPWIVPGLVVGVGVRFFAKEILFFDLVVILGSSTNASFKKISKITFFMISVLTALVISLSLIGVIVDYPFTRQGEVRHGLGFLYCAYPSHLLVYISILYFYLKDKNAPWVAYVVFAVLNIALYVLTDTRSSFALLFVVCVVSVLRKTGKIKAELAHKLAGCVKFLPVIILAVSVGCSVSYTDNSDFWKLFNSATTGRIKLTQNSLNKYGVKPFGQKTEFVGQTLEMGSITKLAKDATPDADRNYIDNSFISVLVKQGWIAEIWVLILLYFASENAHKKKDYLACGFLFIVYLHAAFDPRLLNLLFNSFLFYIWKMATETSFKLPKGKLSVEKKAKHAKEA